MLGIIRSNWRIMKRGTSGSRFKEMYRRRHARRGGSSTAQRVVTLVLGGLLVIAGPVAGLIPGPGGILISLFGWALLASEWFAVARALDWCEPKVRAAWQRIARAWKRATALTRIAVCVVGASCVVLVALAMLS